MQRQQLLAPQGTRPRSRTPRSRRSCRLRRHSRTARHRHRTPATPLPFGWAALGDDAKGSAPVASHTAKQERRKNAVKISWTRRTKSGGRAETLCTPFLHFEKKKIDTYLQSAAKGAQSLTGPSVSKSTSDRRAKKAPGASRGLLERLRKPHGQTAMDVGPQDHAQPKESGQGHSLWPRTPAKQWTRLTTHRQLRNQTDSIRCRIGRGRLRKSKNEPQRNPMLYLFRRLREALHLLHPTPK